MSIVIDKVNKRYASQTVVDHVSLEILDGELFVLLGASGSGKSTLLRMIAGLLPVEEGRIALHGRDVTHLSPQQRNVGFVFQNYSLFRHMTVADNIEFGLDIRGVPKAKRAAKRDELLELIGMAGLGGRYPRQLSGGQQQRVAVARALAFEPSVLLLDEPFGALDVKIRAQLRQTLKTIQRHLKVTTILVTHDQEEAFELADRIGVIEKGQLLEVGVPRELYRRPRHEFVAQFLGTATLLTGRWEAGTLHLGQLALPAPTPPDAARSDGQVAVLLRPEDLSIAHQRVQLAEPALGQGIVEERYFLGTLQRVQVRLEPLPATRSLLADYGEEGVPLQIAHLSGTARAANVEVGEKVWVGVRAFHMLPHAAPHVLLCVDELCDEGYMAQVGEILQRVIEGPVTVLAVAEGREAAERCLAQAREGLGARLPALAFKARQGEAAAEILKEMQEGHYDVALVRGATRDSSGRVEPLAEEVTRHTPIPVLVVKGLRPTIGRILLCTAVGEPGKLDVLFGSRLARRTGASTTLLHVAPLASNGSTLVQHDGSAPPQVLPAGPVTRHLDKGVQTLHNQGVRAEAKLRRGVVLDEILAEATEGNYDVVVVGGHLPTAPLTFLETDLAAQVVRLADRPVLVVRGAMG